MERYIGLDVHAASCTAAVVDTRGKKQGLLHGWCLNRGWLDQGHVDSEGMQR
jgi:hypothetical protein